MAAKLVANAVEFFSPGGTFAVPDGSQAKNPLLFQVLEASNVSVASGLLPVGRIEPISSALSLRLSVAAPKEQTMPPCAPKLELTMPMWISVTGSSSGWPGAAQGALPPVGAPLSSTQIGETKRPTSTGTAAFRTSCLS